jgi:hypothetical protein
MRRSSGEPLPSPGPASATMTEDSQPCAAFPGEEEGGEGNGGEDRGEKRPREDYPGGRSCDPSRKICRSRPRPPTELGVPADEKVYVMIIRRAAGGPETGPEDPENLLGQAYVVDAGDLRPWVCKECAEDLCPEP